MKLLSVEELLARTASMKERANVFLMDRMGISYILDGGVYLLLIDDKVVYVGQTGCLASRIGMHKLEKKMRFNRVEVILEEDAAVREAVEASLIATLNPQYNRMLRGIHKKDSRPSHIKNPIMETRYLIDPDFDY